MIFNWKWVDKMEGYYNFKYWKCKKFNTTIQLFRNKYGYYFLLENKKNDYMFNSAWTSHPDIYNQSKLEYVNEKIKDIDNTEDMKNLVENFIIDLHKEGKI